MPTTCQTPPADPSGLVFQPNHTTFLFPHNDWLMYILYYDDAHLIRQIILSGLSSLRTTYAHHPCVLDALTPYTPCPYDSINRLRTKLLVILEADPPSRARIAAFRSNAIRELNPVDPLKASNFFQEMHTRTLVDWVQDEHRTMDDLIDAARDLYLLS